MDNVLGFLIGCLIGVPLLIILNVIAGNLFLRDFRKNLYGDRYVPPEGGRVKRTLSLLDPRDHNETVRAEQWLDDALNEAADPRTSTRRTFELLEIIGRALDPHGRGLGVK